MHLWQWLLRFGHRNRLPVSHGNDVLPLFSGCDILAATRELIRTAKSTVHFEIYAWADDATGRELMTILQEAAARGVRVRGLVDHAGSWNAMGMFERSGLDIRIYHPIGWRLPWHLWHRRNHRKLLLADGARAVIGSANWSDAYNCEVNLDSYRDLGVEVRGPVTNDLEADFRRSWLRAGGPAFLPSPHGSVAPGEGPAWVRDVAIQLVSTLSGGARGMRRHLFLSFKQLRYRALIANAYFIPGPQFQGILIRALRRGIRMDFILPGVSDHGFVLAASRATFGQLLRAGAGLWERRGRVLHAKVSVLDDDLVILGSANLDSRSFRHNLELNLVLRSQPLAAVIREALEEDRAYSTRLSLEDWQLVPSWRRGFQQFAYRFWWWL